MSKFDFIREKDVMPIGGFYGPHPLFHKEYEKVLGDLYKEEIYEMIAEAGIRFTVYSHTDYQEYPELVERCLDLGAQYGVGMYVLDSNVLQQAEREYVDVEQLKGDIEKYSKHPAFCGIYLVDEPGANYLKYSSKSHLISNYRQLANALQYELGYNCYMNMVAAWKLDENKENYERYVDEFCETLKPKVLVWDKYPFWTTFIDREKLREYFFALNHNRERAKKEKIPFWVFVQAGAQFNDEKKHFESASYFPNEAQFQWNVNTYLAFGAQGILYFPLVQPEHFAYAGTDEEPAWDFKRNGIIGADGNKTQWFDYAKRIHAHIREIDEVLMNAENQGVIVISEQAKKDMEYVSCMIGTGEFGELLSVSGDVMIGCFNYNGKTALYVVNYSMEQEQDVTLCFDKERNIKIVQNAENALVTENKIQLHMTAGEGILVVVES